MKSSNLILSLCISSAVHSAPVPAPFLEWFGLGAKGAATVVENNLVQGATTAAHGTSALLPAAGQASSALLPAGEIAARLGATELAASAAGHATGSVSHIADSSAKNAESMMFQALQHQASTGTAGATELAGETAQETAKKGWFRDPWKVVPKPAESLPDDPIARAKAIRNGQISTGVWSGIGGAIVGGVVVGEASKDNSEA